MFFVYDTTEIGGIFRVASVPLRHYFLGFFHELSLYFLRAEYVVGSDASLTSVQKFAPQHTFHRYIDVGSLVDEDRAVKCKDNIEIS